MSKNIRGRESKKKPEALPPQPKSLGPKITLPKKTNKKALKAIENGDIFWDKRKIAQKAEKKRLERAHALEYRKARTLRKKELKTLTESLQYWVFNPKEQTFTPKPEVTVQLLLEDFSSSAEKAEILAPVRVKVEFPLGDGRFKDYREIEKIIRGIRRALPEWSIVSRF